ncbi:MAG: macro domain-containing protein [Oscillospiraceae bacterium]|nr:macro domain-containing protein [Oscillospiraceae bacterium]
MPFEIVQNDIVNMHVDAIVNTANPDPVIGSGVDYAIHQKAGPELLAARQQIGSIALGDAAITPGFRLAAKYVIHTVGPVWVDGKHQEEQLLSSCYQKSLALAKSYQCGSVAIPLLATGNYGFPKPFALQIAVCEISTFLLENELQIYLVVFDKAAFALSEKLFKSVSSYIDDNYVRSKTLDEYGEASLLDSHIAPRRRRDRLKQRLSGAVERTVEQSLTTQSAGHPGMLAGAACPTPAEDWGQLLKDLDAGFSETLLQLIDRTGKTDAEIYKKANVDRKLFSKIRNNPNYKPSKTTALAFAFALELDVNETRDFIRRAGFALSHSSKFDVIVEYFLVHQNYNVFELNEVLFAFDQPLIGT